MIARSTDDRQILREGGNRLGEILQEVAAAVRPGVTIYELDQLAERLIVEAGGSPAFKGYHPRHAPQPYPGSLCTSVNSEVVHGVPTRGIILKEGDIIGLDIGMQWPSSAKASEGKPSDSKFLPLTSGGGARGGGGGGLYTDTAVTVGVGKISKEAQRLLDVTRQALDAGIAAAVYESRVSDISKAVQVAVELAGFSVIRDLVGHGVGRQVHEEPQVPNFWDPRATDTVLTNGMVIAIEPMVAAGNWRVKALPDGWTIVTQDGSLAAHFEHTVLITKEGTEVMTQA
ncbi:type I methionyl aminopeptidase [Candidatus Uhrbacteria bacterium]|nr:type I methionyl aminopeptidase [Candidatus Uhrbacteria bacterium]